MFIAIGESIIARVAALGGYISFSVTGCPKTPYQQVLVVCFLNEFLVTDFPYRFDSLTVPVDRGFLDNR